MERLFTEADQERIKAAVKAAEERTSGEIVPYVVPQSASYEVALWRTAAAFAVLAMVVLLLVFQFYRGWGLGWLHTGWGTMLVILVAGTAGALLASFVPAVMRRMAGEAVMARAVHQRAMEAFVDEEVFNTRERTGILLFISLLEHRIEVVGDAGINRRVDADDWVEVVARIRRGIQQGRPADGIIEAVEMCGHLLERSGIAIRADDTNELPDGLRMRRQG